jgi:hypothetical protein
LFSALGSKIYKGTYFGWDYSNIVYSFLDDCVNAMAETYRTLEQLVTKEKYISGTKEGELKWKESATKALKESVKILGVSEGINIPEIMRWLDMGWRVYEGGEQDEYTKKKTLNEIFDSTSSKEKTTAPSGSRKKSLDEIFGS